MAENPEKSGSSTSKNQRKPKIVGKEHNFKKRQPQKQEIGDNIIYVSTKSNTKSLLNKCDTLINENVEEIVLHCLGAAIQRGICLALQLCEKHVSYEISANTLTTQLTDDLEPATDEADYEIQRRLNSGLRIRIIKRDLLET